MDARPPVDRCPLCGATSSIPVLAVPYAEIWEELRAELSAVFSKEVVERHQPLPDAMLYRCGECELEYFSPIAAGDAEFYGQLMASIPYELDRWEFGIVANLLGPEASVVDLGCGAGGFLGLVGPRVRRAVGVDHNADAIANLAVAGIEGHTMDFTAFADRDRGAFDVVCSFHTLEHMPQAALLMGPAVACARPGGRIFISVPNRLRYGRGDLEPLDCPPHHISRWDPIHFKVLADCFGVQLVAVRYEEPDLSVARLAYRERSERALSRLAGARAGRFLARAYAKGRIGPRRHARATRARTFTRRGIYGHSMLAEFRRPPV